MAIKVKKRNFLKKKKIKQKKINRKETMVAFLKTKRMLKF